MSVKFLYSCEKTNSFRPTPWHYSTENFPAMRGKGAGHHGFLAVARDYKPTFIGSAASSEGYTGFNNPVYFEASATQLKRVGQKQTLMLIPCSDDQDEQIMLITLRGGFRGGYSRIKSVGCEVFFENTSSGHCVVTGHMIVRLKDPRGYVFAETGRRCSTGLVEIFSWEGYKTMESDEFEAWQNTHAPNMSYSKAIEAKAKAEAERKKALTKAEEYKKTLANAEIAKNELMPHLESLNKRLAAINYQGITFNEINFTYEWSNYDYSKNDVEKIEERVAALEVEVYERKAAEVRAKAEEKTASKKLSTLVKRFQDLGYDLDINDNGYLWNNYRCHFNHENVIQMTKKLEEMEVKAAEALALKNKNAEAAKLGLPQNIQIWRRRGGRTNAGDGWVIQKNGMPREPDEMRCPRPRYKTEGTQIWHQIYDGELVLSWKKGCSSSEHEFEVVYLPEKLTAEQLRTVELLQEELEEDWGDASYPSVGEGWGLSQKENNEEKDADKGTSASDNTLKVLVDKSTPASADALKALVDKHS